MVTTTINDLIALYSFKVLIQSYRKILQKLIITNLYNDIGQLRKKILFSNISEPEGK